MVPGRAFAVPGDDPRRRAVGPFGSEEAQARCVADAERLVLGERSLRGELRFPELERPEPGGLGARTGLRCRDAPPRQGAIGFDRSHSRQRLSGSIGGEESGIHDRDFLSKNAWNI